jgi:hypothetical protein
MALTDLGAPDMVLWRTSHAFTQDVVHFVQGMAHVMQRVGSHDDFTHSDIEWKKSILVTIFFQKRTLRISSYNMLFPRGIAPEINTMRMKVTA